MLFLVPVSVELCSLGAQPGFLALELVLSRTQAPCRVLAAPAARPSVPLQMRSTRKVSVWPVAFVGGLRYESPRVNAAGKVYGWKTVFDPHRPFAIDMAGFAVNLRLILHRPQAYFKLRGVKGGYQESSLLRELVTLSDLEPKAANCTKVRSAPRACCGRPGQPHRAIACLLFSCRLVTSACTVQGKPHRQQRSSC